MSKIKYWRQCRYVAEDGSWDESWIPEPLAVVGKRIYFDDPKTLYTVKTVGERRRTAGEIHDKRSADNRFGPSLAE